MKGSKGGFVVLVLVATVGCHAGEIRGPGTPCDEQFLCRSPLACIEGRCQLADASSMTYGTDGDATGPADAGAADAGPDTSDGGDGPLDGAVPPGEPDHPPILFIFATTDNGGVWLHTVPAGSVAGPGGSLLGVPASGDVEVVDVVARAGSIGPVDDVEAQAIGQVVYLLARRGTDVYQTSVSGESWAPWQQVASDVKAMGLANLEGAAWACLIGSDGHLHLTVQQGSAGWQDMGDVMSAASTPAGLGEAPQSFIKLDCVGMGANLEILALDQDGALWEAVKMPSAWSPFKRLAMGNGTAFRDIDASNAVGELHLLGSQQLTQYHAVRTIEGVWNGFNDVERNVGDPMGEILAGAQTSVLTEVDWLQVNSFGQIWICSRFRYAPTPFLLLRNAAPDGHPFVSLSATAILPY
jgi:hypothetical protein